MPRRAFIISALALGLVGTIRGAEDPVLQARAKRAAALGVPEGDLPPLPKGIVEPPPLPPPETHVRDTPGWKRRHSRARRRVLRRRRPVRRAQKRVVRKRIVHRRIIHRRIIRKHVVRKAAHGRGRR